ncbi:MAG: hypothetical protein K2Q11_02015 [Burkholderiaceae bacterium]|nr:hypothetical protein [Burkholderiaceae bacterium]
MLFCCSVALVCSAALAAPAPWYFWRSKIDGARVCAQTSPGTGWQAESVAFDGPSCQSRRRAVPAQ